MPADPRSLVEGASRGDDASVAALLERYLPGVRAFIRLRAGPVLRARESASDLAQSVCREVLTHLERYQYRGEAEFRHWLFTTALRKIANRRQHWATQKRATDRERHGDADDERSLSQCYAAIATPSRHAASREELARVEAAFDHLSEDHREVILLARVVGLSHREIAARLERSEGAVRVLLHRALLDLSERLADPLP